MTLTKLTVTYSYTVCSCATQLNQTDITQYKVKMYHAWHYNHIVSRILFFNTLKKGFLWEHTPIFFNPQSLFGWIMWDPEYGISVVVFTINTLDNNSDWFQHVLFPWIHDGFHYTMNAHMSFLVLNLDHVRSRLWHISGGS